MESKKIDKRQWFVAEATRKGLQRLTDGEGLRDLPETKEHRAGDLRLRVRAALCAACLGIEVYVPLKPYHRKIMGGETIKTVVPRYGQYIFLFFDRDEPNWGELVRDESHLRYFNRILCDNGIPTPVPERAMNAIRKFRPKPEVEEAAPIVYQPGQTVAWFHEGKMMRGVFVDYVGNRSRIRTWIFGRETLTTISPSALEPLDIDTSQSSAP